MEDRGSLPTGVVTFLLTDVVGSTRLWEGAPTVMAAGLDRHQQVIAGAVARNGGVLLKERGEGDSTFSVFARASDALRAAYEAQVELIREVWATDAPLRVRIALHAGEATEHDGDYVGTAVNRAARLREVANGAEVVVSSSVAALVADLLPADTVLTSMGEVRLRDLARAEEVYVLAGRDLPPARPGPRGQPSSALLDEKGVTRRERDVLDALADRLTNAEVAAQLSISERTVETHVSALLRKLGASNRLELAALAQGLGTATVVELPPMLRMSAARSTCVGRARERAVLLDCWEQAAAGQTLLAVVTGEAGIGKSRLAAELAIEVSRRGGQVLLGSSTNGSDAPFQPFAEALRDTIALAPEPQLRRDLGRHAHALARVLPDVAVRLGAVPPPVGVDPIGERQESHAAIAHVLGAIACRHPTVLVLEDLHWASAPTREAVLALARAGTAPLLVVVTSRDTAPELDPALLGWLADAARLPVATMVPLGGLDLDATAEVMAQLGASTDPAIAMRTTGGNPLFLRELATAGATSATLLDFLADRYERLDDADLDLVDLASALGETFAADVLATAAERPPADVLDALDRARAVGLVEPVTGGAGRYAFTHALYRDVRYAGLSPGRRLHLHARATRALLPRASDPTVLPDLARHACIAAPVGDAAQALELASAAGARCAAAGDHLEAAAHYQRALDVVGLAAVRDERGRLELLIRLGDSVAPSDLQRARAILRDATRLARRLGDAAAFADAVCSMTIEFGSVSAGRDDPAFIALAEEALDLLDDDQTHWRVRILSVLGAHLALGTQPERGLALLREAVALAPSSDDPFDVIRAVLSLHYGLDQTDQQERVVATEAAFEAAERLSHGSISQLAAERLAGCYRRVGDLDAMRRYHQLALDASPVRPLGVLQDETIDAFLRGDLAEMERCNEVTDDVARVVDARDLYSGSILVQLALWRCYPVSPRLEAYASASSFAGDGARALLAFSYLADDRLDELMALLAPVRASGFENLPRGMSRVVALALWGEVVAAIGDRDAATTILGLLDPLAGQLADAAGIVWSSIDQVRAQLELALGRAYEAATVATEAIRASRQRGTRLFLGRELVVAACARRASGGDRVVVRELVAEALAIADDTGGELIRHDAIRAGLVPA